MSSAAADPLCKLFALFSFIFTPGTNYISDGQRGSGKSFFAVACAQLLVENPKGPWGRVVVITNIIFLKRTANGIVRETPENVHHATTMEGMLRKIGEILKEHGRDVRILIILDEAQNFMLSDLNADKVNLALIKWFGTARKFNCITWLISPTIKNFVPRVRNFVDDDEPGYMNGIWRKDIQRARRFVERSNIDRKPIEFITIQYGRHGKSRMLPIPSSSWTRSADDIKVGNYCYDQLASADFTLGEGFEIKPFITRISNVPSHDIPDTILSFFDEKDAEERGDELSVDKIIIRHSMQCAKRAKALELGEKKQKLSDEKIAHIFGMSETTYRRYRDAYQKTKRTSNDEEEE